MLTQSMNGIKEIVLQGDKFKSQNNLRGINSISVLQKDQNPGGQSMAKIPVNYDNTEYMASLFQQQQAQLSTSNQKKVPGSAKFGPQFQEIVQNP